MDYLLDTHTFIWFIEGDEMLPEKTRKEIMHLDNACFLSIGSLWEIAIKSRIGKLNLKVPFHKLAEFLIQTNIKLLSIEFSHLQTLLTLELIHRDPFDRIIVAQAITESLTIITIDKNIPLYPVRCKW